MKLNTFRAAVLTGGICVASISHAQTSYQFIDLGTGSAAGINDRGQVVGSSSLGATLWNGTTPVALDFGAGGYASAINNAGQIVGATVAHGLPEAALWQDNTLTSLNGIGNGITYANCVNGTGQIGGGGDGMAATWNGTTATDLGTNNGISLAVNGISGTGTLVGDVTVYINGFSVATAWNSAGNATLLQSPGGNYSDAYAINGTGVIVGTANTTVDGSTYVAMKWDGTGITVLPSLGGTKSFAYAVNNASLIVGSSTDAAGNAYATLWNGKTAINLNTLLNPAVAKEGWVLTLATGINSEGWIVGDAVNAAQGENDAFLLKVVNPVPEPDTWLMLLAGMGLIGLFVYVKPNASRSAGKRPRRAGLEEDHKQ